MDVSDIFYFFFVRGRGRGSSRHKEGAGGRVFIENPRRGGGSRSRGGRGRGAWRVSVRNLGGGGLNIFFGAEIPTKNGRSRPGKPNQRKGQNEKFMNFAHFCEFWCFSLGKQARFTSNFCSGMPWEKFMNWPFFGLVCRGDS